MEIAMAMGLFFLFVTLVFVFIVLFLPEWVGITGRKAKEVMREQIESEKDLAAALGTGGSSTDAGKDPKSTKPHEP